jgi:hypothetical protein
VKLPELTVTLNDQELPCRFDYDPGEDQWFDARQGVGSPGYPASVVVTSVLHLGLWTDVENFTQEQRDKWDQQVSDQLETYLAAENAASAEAEYDAWKEMQRWGDEMGNTQ